MAKEERNTMLRKPLWPWLLTITLAVFAAGFCSRYCFQLMLIRGESMAPSYHDLQMVVIDKRGKEYARGDVIAFHCEGLSAVLVKRVAAGPGDTVVIEDGTLLVNGKTSAVYPQEGAFAYAGLLKNAIELGAGEYIVLGDNFAQSKDSRYEQVGVVKATDVIGKLT